MKKLEKERGWRVSGKTTKRSSLSSWMDKGDVYLKKHLKALEIRKVSRKKSQQASKKEKRRRVHNEGLYVNEGVPKTTEKE